MANSPQTRIILTAGKGGVGKTTVAAATAALCAREGRRTLVMSIDSAHNLSEVFGVPLGAQPTRIAENLAGLEVDVNHELAENWDAVMDFFRSMTGGNPSVSSLVAEECAVLPGMEEVFGLMRLQSLVETGAYDVVVVDAPPTGDMLKFLRLPDVLQWFMGKYRPLERTMIQRVRPVAEALQWPLPTDESLDQMERWYARVREASATLTDHRNVSVRLVMTPEQVALEETRRAWSWTSLMGMNVDAVIVNRVLPPADYPPPVASWAARQAGVLEDACDAFADLPIMRADLQSGEVLGLQALEEFGGGLFGERSPSGLYSGEPPLQWVEEDGAGEMRLRLPFLKKGQFRLLAGREELSVLVGNQRRVIPLPAALRRRPMQGARYQDGWLRVRFGPPPRVPPGGHPGRHLADG